MGNFFGDALAGLGKIAIERITGLDTTNEAINRSPLAGRDVVIDQLNQLIDLVEKSFNQVKTIFDEISSHGVTIYGDFKFQDVLTDLDKLNKSFFQNVDYVLDRNSRGQNSQFLLLYMEETMLPLVQSITKTCQKLIHNLHGPALLSGTWPEILRIVNFAAEVDPERNPGVQPVLTEINEIGQRLNTLKDELLSRWSPYSDEDLSDWRSRFETQFQLLGTKHNALRASLSQPLAPAGFDGGLAVMEQIKKLGELRDLGLITAEEFETKKNKLLGQI